MSFSEKCLLEFRLSCVLIWNLDMGLTGTQNFDNVSSELGFVFKKITSLWFKIETCGYKRTICCVESAVFQVKVKDHNVEQLAHSTWPSLVHGSASSRAFNRHQTHFFVIPRQTVTVSQNVATLQRIFSWCERNS